MKKFLFLLTFTILTIPVMGHYGMGKTLTEVLIYAHNQTVLFKLINDKTNSYILDTSPFGKVAFVEMETTSAFICYLFPPTLAFDDNVSCFSVQITPKSELYLNALSEVFNKKHLYLRRGWVIFDEGIPSYISCRNDGEKFFWIISLTDYKKNEEGWNQ